MVLVYKNDQIIGMQPHSVVCVVHSLRRRFDHALRNRDPCWGVRNLEDVIEVAKGEGLIWKACVEMPANNLSVLFRKQ